MNTVKIGMFPGRLEDYALEAGTTVREALDMAGIVVSDEYEIKMDGVSVGLESNVTGSMLLVAKRIKGA